MKPQLSPLVTSTTLDNVGPEPPQDCGWAAYRVLIAATVVSAIPCGQSTLSRFTLSQRANLTTGIYLSFGVFHAFYSVSTTFPNANNSAWIGVLSSGVPYLGAPLIVYICTHTPWSRIHWIWTGWLLGVISHVGAAYSPTISALIVNQGLLYGISVLLADNPILLLVNTWFIRHRGIAYGLIFGMSDMCAIGWSFLAQWMLNRFGLRATFLAFAIIMFALPGPCIFLLRERGAKSVWERSTLPLVGHESPLSPVLARRSSNRHQDALHVNKPTPAGSRSYPAKANSQPRFYRRPIFYILALSNLFQAFACEFIASPLPAPATSMAAHTALHLPPSSSALHQANLSPVH